MTAAFRKLMARKLQACSVILLWMMASCCSAGIAVIIHPDNPMNTLSSVQIRDIYLGINKRFPSGDVAVPVDQPGNSKTHHQFASYLLGFQKSQLRAYWAAKIFTGKGEPPRQLENCEKVKEFIKASPNGIGYIDSKMVDDTVKVILTFQPEPVSLR